MSRGPSVERPGAAPAGAGETRSGPLLGGDAPMDEIRVQAVRNALASGRYNMDVHRVADRLAELERLLARGWP